MPKELLQNAKSNLKRLALALLLTNLIMFSLYLIAARQVADYPSLYGNANSGVGATCCAIMANIFVVLWHMRSKHSTPPTQQSA